jgi:hypothetical protein
MPKSDNFVTIVRSKIIEKDDNQRCSRKNKTFTFKWKAFRKSFEVFFKWYIHILSQLSIFKLIKIF